MRQQCLPLRLLPSCCLGAAWAEAGLAGSFPHESRNSGVGTRGILSLTYLNSYIHSIHLCFLNTACQSQVSS